MLTEEFLAGVIERTPIAGLPLVLTFADRDPRCEMGLLDSMHRNGVLEIDKTDEMVVLAVLMSGTYDYDDNKRVRVRLNLNSRHDLLAHLRPHLTELKLQEDHDLSQLQSRRLKKREEQRAIILRDWIDSSVQETLAEWGLTLDHELVEEPGGFHLLKLTIKNNEETVATFELDGWSGFMRINGAWRFNNRLIVRRLRRYMLSEIEDYVEAATAL